MPRIRHTLPLARRVRFPELVEELATELRDGNSPVQPRIAEDVFAKTGLVRVTVIWDRWDRIADEARADTIRAAYEAVEGKEMADRLALVIGLTVPEAHEYGMLPFRVVPALRPTDRVPPPQCRKAMLAVGASVLADPDDPQLRFATREEAQECVRRLTERLPASESIWQVIEEKMPFNGCGAYPED